MGKGAIRHLHNLEDELAVARLIALLRRKLPVIILRVAATLRLPTTILLTIIPIRRPNQTIFLVLIAVRE